MKPLKKITIRSTSMNGKVIQQTPLKTWLGEEILEEIRAVLYLCEYDYKTKTIKVVREMLFVSGFDALQAYANIPNPESQMASGKDQESFEKELVQLHAKLNNPEWVKELAGYL